MTFERMTDVIPYIVEKGLAGMTIYYDEGLDLEGLKNKYSLKQSETVYINLSQLNADTTLTNGETLLKAVYDIYIRTSQDTVETVKKLQDSIQNYSSVFVMLNGTSNFVHIMDNGGSVINDTDKFIQYNIEVYV